MFTTATRSGEANEHRNRIGKERVGARSSAAKNEAYAAKKAKPAKKTARAKKAAGKPKAGRANKKLK